ncbi:unnamed protein product [Spodoptera littoralis]|uniref:Uncharacterized protein n=1 Tax=Spodoptera littoralis TaxID=7109 RepID=A0A9P0I9S9_SPOLI|nr:unnamed protein product [Spodoptera littoralis]CAH1642848.1 unnamed protein product [Spodoptera littoralis]
MRLLLLLILAPAALALYCPSNCYCGLYDELEYRCKSGSNKLTYNARNNEYVNIQCQGANLTCADFPQINFANNQTLPSLWLKGCPPSIIPCLNDALMTSSISFVTLTKLRAPLRADDVEHLGEVQEIMISEGPKDPLPPSALEKLPTLRRLRITSTAMTLNISTFAQSPGLEYLELSDPEITEIPSGIFAGLHKLKMLNFWGNSLSDVEVDSLLGLDSLENLSFTTSRLANISPGAFKHVPNLKSLYIMKNRIEEIAPGLLTNLTQLENITIQLNDIKLHLHSNSITNLPGLKNLIIKDCFAELPKDLITGCEALITLDLSQNRITGIPDNFFKDLKNLEHLDLSYNRIAKLNSGVLSPLKQLKYLNLDRNHLEVLPEFFFAGLRKLEELSINENLLTTINALAFQGATSLQTISMMGNKLALKSQEQIEYAYNMGFEVYSPFNTLIELKKLILSRNNITTIFDDWRIVFTNLEVLDLSHNRIENLNPDNYQFLSKKVTVDLQYNNISTVGMYQPTVSIDHSNQ